MDDFSKNRGVGKSGYETLARGRVGSLSGHPARTFGATPFSVSKSSGRHGVTPDYIAREGNYESKRADLVAVGGRSRDEMDQLIAECHESTRRTDGVVAKAVILELPIELDAASWRRICEAGARWLDERAYASMWAIHNPPKKPGRAPELDADIHTNPHAHFYVVARPILHGHVAASGSGQSAGEGKTIWGEGTISEKHPDGFKAWKRHVGNTQTHEMTAAGFDMILYPGKAKDIGITREPEKRLPAGAWFAGARHRDPEKVAAKHAVMKAKREQAAKDRDYQAKARKERIEKQARAIGMVGGMDLAAAEAGMLEVGNILMAERAEWSVKRRELGAQIGKARQQKAADDTEFNDLAERFENLKANAITDARTLHRVTEEAATLRRELERAQVLASPKQVALIAKMAIERGISIDPDAFAGMTGLTADRHIAELREMPLQHIQVRQVVDQTGTRTRAPEPLHVPLDVPLAVAPSGKKGRYHVGQGYTFLDADEAAEALRWISKADLEQLCRVTDQAHKTLGGGIGTDRKDCLDTAVGLLRSEMQSRPAERTAISSPTSQVVGPAMGSSRVPGAGSRHNEGTVR